ncbi:MAG TPA: hypothetical protein VK681_39120 [Reyranella sp.]|nr:hypothetical protein [Reyranella sp.]
MATQLISKRRKLALALDRSLHALEDLEWQDRPKVLRWVCDEYGIDPARLPLIR